MIVGDFLLTSSQNISTVVSLNAFLRGSKTPSMKSARNMQLFARISKSAITQRGWIESLEIFMNNCCFSFLRSENKIVVLKQYHIHGHQVPFC